MRLFICIDDTDNLTKGRGTGRLAEEMRMFIEEQGWGKTSRITRHQLLLHEDIPYTSHNSSMCFIVYDGMDHYNDIKDYCCEYLVKEHADGSDPGLCIVKEDDLKRERLISYGFETKFMIKTKEEAYEIAHDCGYHLSEHGGTGLGVIGALAGIGLRVSGEDGEFKGRLDFIKDKEQKVFAVRELLSYDEIESVVAVDSSSVSDDALVNLGHKTKTVLMDGKSVLLVKEKENQLISLSKKEIREFGEMHSEQVFYKRKG